MLDKFEQKEKEFQAIIEECFKLFAIKNKHYGNDYFEGDYSALERWLSVRRKVARLEAHYKQGQESKLPDEKIEDTWKDLAVYCIMELMILGDKK